MQSPNPPAYSRSPMGHPPRDRSIVVPVILIILGLVFLGRELGFFHLNLWDILWRLWPVWLIALGLEIMLGRSTAWGSWVVVGVVITVVGGAFWLDANVNPQVGSPGEPVAISQPVGPARRAEVRIDSSVSRLSITSGTADNLVEGTVTPLEWETIQQDARESGDTLIFTLRSRGDGRLVSLPVSRNRSSAWDLRLSDKVPLDLRVDTGVGDAHIDLARVQLTSLELDTGVGETEVSLPGEGRYRVDIDSGVGKVTLRLPRGLAVRVHVDQGIGAVRVRGDLAHQSKSTYVSPNFSQAEHRAEIEIDGGIGEIVIDQY